MNLLLKYRFHTPLIRFVGKRDGLPHKPAPAQQSAQGQFSFDSKPRILSTTQLISEKARNIINLGGVIPIPAKK